MPGVPSDEPDADAEAARRARFEHLARPLIDPLRRYLIRRTDPATADDVLSETLLVCWRRLDDVPAEALPWAYGVARRCLANAERGVRRQQRLAGRIAAVDPPRPVAPGAGEGDTGVLEALDRLRADDAELLRLWAWEQLGPAEIAEVLGITANAARVRLHRARRRLRDELGNPDRGAGHEQSTEGSGR